MKTVNEKEKIGMIINDLKIISFVGRKSNNLVFIAKCLICGREKEIWLKDFVKGSGTYHKNCIWTIGLKNISKKFYTIWTGMRDRTTNPNYEHYRHYGGRGISSEQYKFFIDFYDDFYYQYCEHVRVHGEKNTTIERIDVNKNYEKNNIKFATWEEQHKNTTRNRNVKITYPNGDVCIIKCMSDFIKSNEDMKDSSSIYDCLKNKREKYKGYRFEYVD